jgi:hypothetical protein
VIRSDLSPCIADIGAALEGGLDPDVEPVVVAAPEIEAGATDIERARSDRVTEVGSRVGVGRGAEPDPGAGFTDCEDRPLSAMVGLRGRFGSPWSRCVGDCRGRRRFGRGIVRDPDAGRGKSHKDRYDCESDGGHLALL